MLKPISITFRAMLQNPDTTAGAGIYLATSLGIYLGQGGRFVSETRQSHHRLHVDAAWARAASGRAALVV
jgi:hypothetical protein